MGALGAGVPIPQIRAKGSSASRGFKKPLLEFKEEPQGSSKSSSASDSPSKNKDTIASLNNKIKTYLDEHPALANNAHFSALFGAGRRCTHWRHVPHSQDSAPNTSATSSSHPSTSSSLPTPPFGLSSSLPVSQPPAALGGREEGASSHGCRGWVLSLEVECCSRNDSLPMWRGLEAVDLAGV
ncbi:hypothetical protein C8R48DRAFT_764816 [Suillus tomentosus]|nr:hypothetical protein C8R48DRAFT_764816 [Suillus tomentosus]